MPAILEMRRNILGMLLISHCSAQAPPSCTGTCISTNNSGGCHRFDGNTACDSPQKFAFGYPSADKCIYDPVLQFSLCYYYWEDHGGDDAHVRRCATSADCPVRYAAMQCRLAPSGGIPRPSNERPRKHVHAPARIGKRAQTHTVTISPSSPLHTRIRMQGRPRTCVHDNARHAPYNTHMRTRTCGRTHERYPTRAEDTRPSHPFARCR